MVFISLYVCENCQFYHGGSRYIYWLSKHINVLMDESMACVGMWYHTHTDVLID